MKQVLIAIDQLVNTILGGMADETFSARAWRNKNRFIWRQIRFIIDTIFIFQKNHCYMAFISEIKRKQLPKEYQDRYE